MAPLNWRSALAAQALSDYRVYRHLSSQRGVEKCHVLHYLHMSSEKLAKAFIIPHGGQAPKPSHRQLAKFLRLAPSVPALVRSMGFEKNKAGFNAMLRNLQPIAERVEVLAPTAAMDIPNSEFPWVDAENGVVVVPARYRYPEFDPTTDPDARRLLYVLERFFRYVDAQLTTTGTI